MTEAMSSTEATAARLVGRRLRAAREEAGVSLRELAQRVGLRDHTVLIKYEQGRTAPTSTRLISLARALGVSPAALLASHDAAIPLITAVDQADEVQLAQLSFAVETLQSPDPEPPEFEARPFQSEHQE
jgi:transcriptional regulator with XRE-family HTH domain